jgi:hypothetical protein
VERSRQHFDDFLARLSFSEQNGRGAWGEGVTVQPPDGALLEALSNGSVHPSLVVEPNGDGLTTCSKRPLGEQAQAA